MTIAPEPSVDHGMSICTNCGFKIPDDLVICWKCGEKQPE
jgi:hypothetical protein